MNVVKGTRIKAQWWDTKLVPLAGATMKTQASLVEVVGIVRHIRGNHPTTPTQIELHVELDNGDIVQFDPKHVVEIL